MTCYLCDRKHIAQNCDLKDDIREFVRDLKARGRITRHKSHRKQQECRRPLKGRGSKLQRGHVTNDAPESAGSDGDESSSTESNDAKESEDETEVAAISKEVISKI